MVPRYNVEDYLRRAERWWRGLLLVRRFSLLGCGLALVVLLIGVMMYTGSFRGALLPGLMFVCLALFALLGAIFVLMMTLEKRAGDSLLASALERAHQPLLDRLHALVHLRQRNDDKSRQLLPLIERQALDILRRCPASCPFPRKSVTWHLLALALSLLITISFYAWFQPWRFMRERPQLPPVAEAESDLDLPPLTETSADPRDDPLNAQPWTDVRISEPGKDLRVTRHEVIPLRIEAASNRQLTKVEWITAVNGGPPRSRSLPPPEDSRYAGYDTQLVPEDEGLQSWDVMSYFARATTADGQTHESDIYFLEVIPYRDELDELSAEEQAANNGPENTEQEDRGTENKDEEPGATPAENPKEDPSGKSEPNPKQERGTDQEPRDPSQVTRSLEDMTDLVQRQQEVIRQTRQIAPRAEGERQSEARERQLERLAREEAGLREAMQRLEAALRSRVDDKVLQPVNEAVQKADRALESAERKLREDQLSEATQKEREALGELAELRKAFQQVAQQHPEALADDSQPSANALQQMRDRQQGMQAARDFVQNTLSNQRDLQRSVPSRPNQPLGDQARRQLELQQALEQYARQNPEPFEKAGSQQQSACSAMRQAAQGMQQPSPAARQQAAQAADALQQLDNALQQQQQRDQLADAMRLQRALERQVEQLERFQQDPQSASPGQCQQAAAQAKAATGQLARMCQNPGSGSPLGSELQQAMAGGKEGQVASASEQLSQAGTPDEVRQASQGLADQLRPLADMLARQLGTQPGARPGEQPGERPSEGPNRRPGERPGEGPNGRSPRDASPALRPQGPEAVDRGLRQLDSIALRQSQGRSNPQARSQLSRDALRNLSDGLTGMYGQNQRTEAVLGQLEEKLEEQVTPVDEATVQQLLRQMQLLRREAVNNSPRPRSADGLLGLDPEKVAPEYRDWARKYFEELSRQSPSP